MNLTFNPTPLSGLGFFYSCYRWFAPPANVQATLRVRSRKRGCSRYSARTALNVPCFEGRSPTSGANSTSPLIESGVSNFPLNINVPASRPTLPSINSTGPVNVTEFWSSRVHFASEGLPGPQTFNLGSTTSKVPFPASCASNRSERLFPSANVMSTFHLPIISGDCPWAMAPQNI